MPSSCGVSERSSSTCRAANCSGVYGSFMTCAPGSAGKPSPRVKFTYSTSNPPEPSPRSRACVLTTTSSPSATGPVSCGYATQARPSTSTRASPSCRSCTAVTTPRRRLSGTRFLEERERDVHHRLEVGDRDVLVRAVDVRHPVREIDAGEAAQDEDVRVRPAAAERVDGLVTRALERGAREPDRLVLLAEAIALVPGIDAGLDFAPGQGGGEGARLEHLLNDLRELALVV